MAWKHGLSSLLAFLVVLASYQLVLAVIPLTPAQESTLHFLRSNTPLPLPYIPEERSHLRDVQHVMWGADVLGGGLLFIFLLGFFRLNTKKREEVLQAGGKYALIICLLLLLLVGVLFPLTFTGFHLLLFPQGNWQFSPDSLLIKTFPLIFFQEFSAALFFLAFLGGLVLWRGKQALQFLCNKFS